MKKKNLFPVFIALLALAGVASCDMQFVNEAEPRSAETAGPGLTLINMPPNTLAKHVKTCFIAESMGNAAHINTEKTISVSANSTRASLFIPLAAADGGAFLESGSFYVILAVYIDALTWINITADSKVLVEFSDGRGTLDVLSLTGDAISPQWPVTPGGKSEEELELARTGRYLRLLNMPINTIASNVRACYIAGSQGNVARLNSAAGTAVFRQTQTATVYVNLSALDGSEFTASGDFYIVLSVYIDARTWIEIKRESALIIPFSDGQGTLDVLSLHPGDTVSPEWPVTEPEPGGGGNATPDEIEEMERNGRFLMLYGLPAGTRAEFITGLAVTDGARAVAVPDPKTKTLTAAENLRVNAWLPLTSPSGGVFNRTGSFLVAFSVRVDALTSIIVRLADNVIVSFDDGRGSLDIDKLLRERPELDATAPDPETENQIESIIASGGYIRFYNRALAKLQFYKSFF